MIAAFRSAAISELKKLAIDVLTPQVAPKPMLPAHLALGEPLKGAATLATSSSSLSAEAGGGNVSDAEGDSPAASDSNIDPKNAETTEKDDSSNSGMAPQVDGLSGSGAVDNSQSQLDDVSSSFSDAVAAPGGSDVSDLAGSTISAGSEIPEDSVEVVGDWHKAIVVMKDGKKTIFEGQPDDVSDFFTGDANLDVKEKSRSPVEIIGERVKVSPPAGMSDGEFADAVLREGREEVASSGSLGYSLPGGDCGQTSANSNSILRNIIDDAGGDDMPRIETTWPTPGLNCGKPIEVEIQGPDPFHMDPKDAPPGTLEQPGQSNSPPVGGFSVDPVSGKVTYG